MSKAGVMELHGRCAAGEVAESIGDRPDAGAPGKRREPAGRRERVSSFRDRGDGAAFVAEGVNIFLPTPPVGRNRSRLASRHGEAD